MMVHNMRFLLLNDLLEDLVLAPGHLTKGSRLNDPVG
jgi:hypothetical protein